MAQQQRKRRVPEPIVVRAARAGERAGTNAAEGNRTAARRTRETVRGHPSTAERRRFGATGEGAAPDTAPAHAAGGLFGETPPISKTPLRKGVTVGAQPRGGTRAAAGRARTRRTAGFGAAPFSGTSGSQHVVMMLYLVTMLVVLLRSIADYVPDADLSKPGKVNPNKGLGPLPMAAAVSIWYFVLASLAVGGGRRGQVAVAFGSLTLIALLLNSSAELSTVEGWIANLGAPPSPVDLGSSSAGATGTGTGQAGTGTTDTGTPGQSGSRQAAINAWQAFARAENEPVTGVISAAEHAGKGTWDIVTSAGDWLVTLFSGGGSTVTKEPPGQRPSGVQSRF